MCQLKKKDEPHSSHGLAENDPHKKEGNNFLFNRIKHITSI